ncbi:hypothetical protein Tco_0659324 [Tanacetum coccineum]
MPFSLLLMYSKSMCNNSGSLSQSPRVPNQEFTVPPYHGLLMAFLMELGYKGQMKQLLDIARAGKEEARRDTQCVRARNLQHITPKKTTLASRNIKPKKKESSGDELDESDVGPANRPTCRRKPKGVTIRDKDIPRVLKKKSIDHSQKLKGAGITLVVLDEPTRKSAVSNKGAGISLEVPDETKDKSKAQDDLDDWGSIDDETFLFNDKDELVEEIPLVYTDDESVDIENTDDERTESDNDDYEMTDAVKTDANKLVKENSDKEHEENAEKVEEQKVDEEQKGDDQAEDEQVGVPISKILKEKPNLIQSTSSHFVSSNFGNQFLNNSPNVSLIGTIQENAKAEINSLLDIQIQQEVFTIQQEPFHEVKVSVIPEPTQIPPSTPPTTSLLAPKAPAAPVLESEALTVILQRVSDLEKDVKELKQVDHSSVILELIKSRVPSAIDKCFRDHKDQTRACCKGENAKILNNKIDQAADDKYVQKDILFKMMMASKSYEQHPTHKALYDALIQSLLVDENDMDRHVVDPLSKKKRRHEDKDQDPPAGSDQRMKKRRTGKDAKPSMKSSKSKESTKDKTPSNTSKIGKSISIDKSVKELEHVVPMDDEEPNLDNVANDADKPEVDATPKIPKQD